MRGDPVNARLAVLVVAVVFVLTAFVLGARAVGVTL